MLTVEDLVEAIYRAHHARIAEDAIALTLLSEEGVSVLTLRQCREHLAVALCKDPP